MSSYSKFNYFLTLLIMSFRRFAIYWVLKNPWFDKYVTKFLCSLFKYYSYSLF